MGRERRVQIDSIDERIRDLCAKVTVAQGPEVETILSELRAALKEHAEMVRYLALHTLNHLPQYESSPEQPFILPQSCLTPHGDTTQAGCFY